MITSTIIDYENVNFNLISQKCNEIIKTCYNKTKEQLENEIDKKQKNKIDNLNKKIHTIIGNSAKDIKKQLDEQVHDVCPHEELAKKILECTKAQGVTDLIFLGNNPNEPLPIFFGNHKLYLGFVTTLGLSLGIYLGAWVLIGGVAVSVTVLDYFQSKKENNGKKE